MSWLEAMKEKANGESRNHDSNETHDTRSAAPTSWDPYEVWLTRVKQPRGRTVSRDPAGVESQARMQSD